MDAANSLSASSSNVVRGCFGFGDIELISTSARSATTTQELLSILGNGVDGIRESSPRPNPPLRVLMM